MHGKEAELLLAGSSTWRGDTGGRQRYHGHTNCGGWACRMARTSGR